MTGEVPDIVRRILHALRRLRPRRYRSAVTLTVRLEPDELDGGWIAECEELPGCMSQGETEEEALANVQDAIGAVLASHLDATRETQHHAESAVHRHQVTVAIGA